MLTNLLVVVAAGLLAPLMLGFFPRVRLPAIVLEIVLGIVIGPSGLGWVKPDAPVSILALVGLAFLLFLSGLEIDVDRLRGRIVKITALGFAGVVCHRDPDRDRLSCRRLREVPAVRRDRARGDCAGSDFPGA
jgi:Kef-type K+ transport system membrane component KefB